MKHTVYITLTGADNKITSIDAEEFFGNVSFGAPYGESEEHTIGAEFTGTGLLGHHFVVHADGATWRALEGFNVLNDFVRLCVIDADEAASVADLIASTSDDHVYIQSAYMESTLSTAGYAATCDRESMKNAVDQSALWEDDGGCGEVNMTGRAEKVSIAEMVSRRLAATERINTEAILQDRLRGAQLALESCYHSIASLAEGREMPAYAAKDIKAAKEYIFAIESTAKPKGPVIG